ncbi:acetamidase/formamidase family protein [Paenibacillus thiaminolyticus]|uniref:acetamidase/formamidase family protein n=1 Tax=Paenibacillus thiaminolyticus TaxID=49283 RepID=UPI00233019BB|nr:acetamidase/formamidase family protein [Paenibacillus thiaminolyticus]WCF08927.1 acetamidase/formamidase family protein [Paenibacillus thiaminolyticus]
MPKIHELNPDADTLHGFFSKDLEPALTIDSGDTVVFRTLDAGWGLERRAAPGQPRKKFTERKPSRQCPHFGHALVGPVYIRGARPGQTLEMTLHEIVPGSWGWTSAGGFPSYWNEKLGMTGVPEVTLDFALDADRMVGRSQFGNFDYAVGLKPFMGVMGMPPPEPGQHTTFVPRPFGGNIDCKELQAGSTLYLPIPVEGGLFSIGDGHAVQGDGEVAGPALECPMERVSCTFTVRDDLPLAMPRAKTATGWLTMGFHEDLEEAMWMALQGMLDWMSSLYGLSRTEAYAYASLAVDLRITQIVNSVKGVHALLPYDALR